MTKTIRETLNHQLEILPDGFIFSGMFTKDKGLSILEIKALAKESPEKQSNTEFEEVQ